MRYGPHGKPHLAGEFDGALQFNLAHSHELALFAFARGPELGIDLEWLQPLQDLEQIAARFFSPRENAVLRTLPKSQWVQAFFNCWTRKEAYLKATGDGLARPLEHFDVSLAPGKPARLLYVEGDARESERWFLRALTPAPGYAAALAVEEGQHCRLVRWRWLGA
jgi:4'-phosphopantetheinyl transferase